MARVECNIMAHHRESWGRHHLVCCCIWCCLVLNIKFVGFFPLLDYRCWHFLIPVSYSPHMPYALVSVCQVWHWSCLFQLQPFFEWCEEQSHHHDKAFMQLVIFASPCHKSQHTCTNLLGTTTLSILLEWRYVVFFGQDSMRVSSVLSFINLSLTTNIWLPYGVWFVFVY